LCVASFDMVVVAGMRLPFNQRDIMHKMIPG
jgi:hypothetical protein